MGNSMKYFHSIVEPPLNDILGILMRKYGPKKDAQVEHDIELLRNVCAADCKRNSQPDVSREEPVYWGDAINLTRMPSAKIFLIDSSTRRGLYKLPQGISIQAMSIRNFLPGRGNKGDRRYFEYLKSFGCSDQEVVSMINMKYYDNGNFMPPVPEHMPRICLLFANMDSEDNRVVLMLRPQYNLNDLLYEAYIHVVISIITKQLGGEVDFDSFSEWDENVRSHYYDSMILTDCMLSVKSDPVFQVRRPTSEIGPVKMCCVA